MLHPAPIQSLDCCRTPEKCFIQLQSSNGTGAASQRSAFIQLQSSDWLVAAHERSASPNPNPVTGLVPRAREVLHPAPSNDWTVVAHQRSAASSSSPVTGLAPPRPAPIQQLDWCRTPKKCVNRLRSSDWIVAAHQRSASPSSNPVTGLLPHTREARYPAPIQHLGRRRTPEKRFIQLQ